MSSKVQRSLAWLQWGRAHVSAETELVRPGQFVVTLEEHGHTN